MQAWPNHSFGSHTEEDKFNARKKYGQDMSSWGMNLIMRETKMWSHTHSQYSPRNLRKYVTTYKARMRMGDQSNFRVVILLWRQHFVSKQIPMLQGFVSLLLNFQSTLSSQTLIRIKWIFFLSQPPCENLKMSSNPLYIKS